MLAEPSRLDEILRQPANWVAGDVGFWIVGNQGPNTLWLGRFGAGSIGSRSPWERHLDGPELLHVLEGAVELTLMNDGGAVRMRVDAGSIFIVPAGVWHAHTPLAPTLEFGATLGKSEHSTADDPR
jgi:hypothetical protein